MKKKIFTLLIGITCYLGLNAVVIITPDQGINTNALTAAIDANPNETVFELQRNGVYIVDKEYTFTRYVELRAQTGVGDMPIVDVVTDANGAKPSQVFKLQKNIKVTGIYFNGDTRGSGIVSHIFRATAGTLTFTFDGCYFDKAEQTVLRMDVAGNKAFFNNCIFRNIAQTANIDNGRIVDSRSQAQDSITFTNSTFYNNTGQLFRYGSNNTVNSLIVDHCTFYNSGYRMCLDFAINGTYTNNIMADCGWKAVFSADNGTTPPVATYLNSTAFIDSLKTSVDATRKFVISNNNIYDTPDLTAAYAAYPTKVLKRQFIFTPNPWVNNNQLTMANNIAEVLQFTNPSQLTIDFIKAYFDSSGNSSFNTTSNLSFYVEETANMDAPDVAVPFSFVYPKNAQSATASTTGGPLGDTRWTSDFTGLNNVKVAANVNVFPNPVADYLNIRFANSGLAKINVYDMEGKTVYFDNRQQAVNAGETLKINLQSLAKGCYLYFIEQMDGGIKKTAAGKIVR